MAFSYLKTKARSRDESSPLSYIGAFVPPCVWVCVTLASLATGGCSLFEKSQSKGYITIPDRPQKKADEAKKANTKGLAAMRDGKLDVAEKHFGDALAADVNYGPAHNNLGQVYLKRHQLYLAAWEFQFATSLMPERGESLSNLGLVYETAGQLEKSLEFYEAAHEIDPHDRDALGNLARVSVKLDADPRRIAWLLNEIIMHDDRCDWTDWAKTLLATRFRAANGLVGVSESLPLDSRTSSERPVVPRIDGGLGPSEELPLPVPAPVPPESGPLSEAAPLELSKKGTHFPSRAFADDLPMVPQAVFQANFESSPMENSP